MARKEKNFGLAEKFLLKSLTGRTNFNIGLEDLIVSNNNVGYIMCIQSSSKDILMFSKYVWQLGLGEICFSLRKITVTFILK